MAREQPKRVREQVVVYLDERDRDLLEKMTGRTGLSKTELFRRGLRRLADETLGANAPGFSLRHLIATAGEDDLPVDLAARADEILYGGAYQQRGKPKRARPR